MDASGERDRKLAEAVRLLVRELLCTRPELASSIAVLAELVSEEAAALAEAESAATVPPVSGEATAPPAPQPQEDVAPSNEEPSAPAVPSAAKPAAQVEVKSVAAAAPPPLPETSAILKLKIGDDSTHLKVAGTRADIYAARSSIQEQQPAQEPRENPAGWQLPDLTQVTERCAAKAEACRALAALEDAGAWQPREAEKVRVLFEKAQLAHVHIHWTMTRAKPGADAVRLVSEGYANLSHAARLAHHTPAGSARRSGAFQLLAEAQSALRLALAGALVDRDDADQWASYQFLAMFTKYEQIFVPRHMRLDDAADPANWQDLRTRLQAALQPIDAAARREHQSSSLIKKLAYHVKRIVHDRSHDEHADWLKVEESLRALAQHGVGGDDPRVVDRLRLIAERLRRRSTCRLSAKPWRKTAIPTMSRSRSASTA
ncbi:MAG TPA: hypothetical protein VD997_16765 [Phycisphaerales bacterium]|nr:hypothetical protein [Phycisphaerales bacterium]